MKKINAFTLHNDRGHAILATRLLQWRESFPLDASGIFGPVIYYSWTVNTTEYRLPVENSISIRTLPDDSGLICFEREWKPDNCTLLDVYGEQIMRLTVPWQLTGPRNPQSAKPPTSFAHISAPYVNPLDGKLGNFGVEAWVEHAGQYYFELDYHTGQFLWGKEIRD